MGVKLLLISLSVPLWGLDSFPASGSSHQQTWVWLCCKLSLQQPVQLCQHWLPLFGLFIEGELLEHTEHSMFSWVQTRTPEMCWRKRSQRKTVSGTAGSFRLLPAATLGYLFPGKRQLRFFWNSLLAPVTGGRIIVVHVLERRENWGTWHSVPHFSYL